ncbi:MAG: aldehyde ferredoxin oxidoreductase C-terminal domain-containing protein [Candidatus Hodarchaeales archaeon]
MAPRIIRVNMTDQTIKEEAFPEKYKTFGGRALTTNIVADEVDPLCHPLGPNNKIVIAPGFLTGTNAPSSGRLSVGGKGALTGTLKEANAGGITPQKLAKLGIKAVIIEGQPKEDKWWNLYITKGKIELVDGAWAYQMGLYELIAKVWEKYPNKPGIVGCGPTGQRLLKASGIFGNNPENNDPGRYAGRGGLGAVLGSKRVIAIITDDTGGEAPTPADLDKFNKGRVALRDGLLGHAVTGKDGGLQNYGTNVLQNIINEAGALPVRNWTKGQWDGAAKISGEATHEAVDKAKEKFGDASEGKYAHACHPGCVMRCSNAVPDPDTGKLIVSPLEYETAWSLGSNTEIDDLIAVSKLNRVCNDIGIDTIEAGNILSVAMEAGITPFGDGPKAIEILKECAKGTPLGNILGSGALAVGEAYGVTRVAHVKGQSLPAYDPRVIKGIGVTYATGTQGGCHTQGYTVAAEILGIKEEVTDKFALEKAELSRVFQATTAYIDSTGYCLFIAFCILDVDEAMQGMVDTVNAMLGQEIDVGKYGTAVLKREIEFNRKAGFTEAHDRLPEFMKLEPVPPHNTTFDVPDEELDKVHGK